MTVKNRALLGNQNAKGNKGPWADRPITDLLRRTLLQGDAKKARRMAENLVKQGMKNNPRAVQAIKEVLDRVEGKVPQGIVGADGGPLTVEVVRFGQGKNPGK